MSRNKKIIQERKALVHNEFDVPWILAGLMGNAKELRSLQYQFWAAVVIKDEEIGGLLDCIFVNPRMGGNHVKDIPPEYDEPMKKIIRPLLYQDGIKGNIGSLVRFLKKWHLALKEKVRGRLGDHYDVNNVNHKAIITDIVTKDNDARRVRIILGLEKEEKKEEKEETKETEEEPIKTDEDISPMIEKVSISRKPVKKVLAKKKLSKESEIERAKNLIIDAVLEGILGNEDKSNYLRIQAENILAKNVLSTEPYDKVDKIIVSEMYYRSAYKFYENKQYKKAFNDYCKAAELNCPEACFDLSFFYRGGIGCIVGIEDDLEKARQLISTAESLGFNDLNYDYRLAIAYMSGEVVEKDVAKGIRLLTKCSGQGSLQAKCYLGNYCCNGEGVKKNWLMGAKLLLEAASQGDSDAQYLLGINFFPYGTGRKGGEIAFYPLVKSRHISAGEVLGELRGSKDANTKLRVKSCYDMVDQENVAVKNTIPPTTKDLIMKQIEIINAELTINKLYENRNKFFTSQKFPFVVKEFRKCKALTQGISYKEDILKAIEKIDNMIQDNKVVTEEAKQDVPGVASLDVREVSPLGGVGKNSQPNTDHSESSSSR